MLTSESVAVAGLSWHHSPPDIRDSLRLDASDLAAAAGSTSAHAREVILLSTCNRTEVYVSGTAPSDAQAAATRLLADLVGCAAATTLAYGYHDCWAAHHLFRVVAGLESQSVGEPQIVRQVRLAYQQARAAGTTGPLLSRLFESAAAASKRIRSQTPLSSSARSLPATLLDFAEELAGPLSTLHILIVGAGEVAGMVAAEARKRECARLTVANRDRAHAERLACTLDGDAVALESLPAALIRADVIITATASREPVITEASLAGCAPAAIFDLAIPRDVSPGVERLAPVFGLDALGHRATISGDVLAQADEIARIEADGFGAWLATRGLVPAITSLRDDADRILEDHLACHAVDLLRLSPEVGEVVERLAGELTRQLVHRATLALNQASLLSSTRRLAQQNSLEPWQQRGNIHSVQRVQDVQKTAQFAAAGRQETHLRQAIQVEGLVD